jgi:hypothetical protein
MCRAFLQRVKAQVDASYIGLGYCLYAEAYMYRPLVYRQAYIAYIAVLLQLLKKPLST